MHISSNCFQSNLKRKPYSILLNSVSICVRCCVMNFKYQNDIVLKGT